MARRDEVPRKCTTATSELEDETSPNRFEQFQDAGSARVRVECIPAMVREREIGAVVGVCFDGKNVSTANPPTRQVPRRDVPAPVG